MKTQDKSIIVDIINKYRGFGVIKGGELCLPKNKILNFLDDLESLNIGILGFDGWYYVDQSKKIIAQDLDVDVSIDKAVSSSADFIEKSFSLAKEYILTKLPERTAFISVTLDIPYLWKELFPESEN